MGHFFRALTIYDYFKAYGERAIIIINDDKVSVRMLDSKKMPYEIVCYNDLTSNWEKKIIHKYQVDMWLLDKFETDLELAIHVKAEGVLLVAIDDCGEGSQMLDIHFCSMLFHNIRGKNIYSGKDYLILNPEIARYRKLREEKKRILVTLGGSDTYGVTVKVVRFLKKLNLVADVVIGPNFRHKKVLLQETGSQFIVYETVPSLIAKFYEYDLAITGGGVTCFEANASGLPCIIIANELHEIEIGKYLAGFHGARFAGYYQNLSQKDFDIGSINIREMSKAALQAVKLDGLDNIYRVICGYRSRDYER